jgi:hypothetical protein
MPLVARRSEGKNIDLILAEATDRLLRGTKSKMLRDYGKLAREGVNAALIQRLKLV